MCWQSSSQGAELIKRVHHDHVRVRLALQLISSIGLLSSFSDHDIIDLMIRFTIITLYDIHVRVVQPTAFQNDLDMYPLGNDACFISGPRGAAAGRFAGYMCHLPHKAAAGYRLRNEAAIDDPIQAATWVQ